MWCEGGEWEIVEKPWEKYQWKPCESKTKRRKKVVKIYRAKQLLFHSSFRTLNFPLFLSGAWCEGKYVGDVHVLTGWSLNLFWNLLKAVHLLRNALRGRWVREFVTVYWRGEGWLKTWISALRNKWTVPLFFNLL